MLDSSSPPTHTLPTRTRHRRGLGVATLAGLVALAACSSTSTEQSSTGTASPATTTMTTSAPATTGTSAPTGTTSRTATTSRPSTTGTVAGATAGACGWLTVEEVQAATGSTVSDASPVRGGCRWENGSTPVVDVEVERPSAGAASAFQSAKALYQDDTVTLPAIGDDRYWAGLEENLVFLHGDAVYTVWIQTIDDERRTRDATVALAEQLERRLP